MVKWCWFRAQYKASTVFVDKEATQKGGGSHDNNVYPHAAAAETCSCRPERYHYKLRDDKEGSNVLKFLRRLYETFLLSCVPFGSFVLF